MSIDIMQSRRNYNVLCRWWTKNKEDDIDDSELVMKRIPNGIFYAKEINAETDNDNILGGVFMINRKNITIASPDNLEGISSEDHVEYQGIIWRVESVQKRKFRIQNSEFCRIDMCSHIWYLTLVR